MRSEEEIRGTLISHGETRRFLENPRNSEALRENAKAQKRTVEWVRGYLEGVDYGYRFALGED